MLIVLCILEVYICAYKCITFNISSPNLINCILSHVFNVLVDTDRENMVYHAWSSVEVETYSLFHQKIIS